MWKLQNFSAKHSDLWLDELICKHDDTLSNTYFSISNVISCNRPMLLMTVGNDNFSELAVGSGRIVMPVGSGSCEWINMNSDCCIERGRIIWTIDIRKQLLSSAFPAMTIATIARLTYSQTRGCSTQATFRVASYIWPVLNCITNSSRNEFHLLRENTCLNCVIVNLKCAAPNDSGTPTTLNIYSIGSIECAQPACDWTQLIRFDLSTSKNNARWSYIAIRNTRCIPLPWSLAHFSDKWNWMEKKFKTKAKLKQIWLNYINGQPQQQVSVNWNQLNC